VKRSKVKVVWDGHLEGHVSRWLSAQ